ncbi:hypothetical protein HYV86_00275 [Candidatus Woesearchaeota archaeon]|nr:hypothetical protein [Candidatus Woesearchaeota archaeon]
MYNPKIFSYNLAQWGVIVLASSITLGALYLAFSDDGMTNHSQIQNTQTTNQQQRITPITIDSILDD